MNQIRIIFAKMTSLLDQEIQFLPGVGPARARLLERELGIHTIKDLLYHFPFKYTDRSRIYQIREIQDTTAAIQLSGRIISLEVIGQKRKERLEALFSDGTGTIKLVWFKGVRYLQKSLKTDTDYVLFGKPQYFNGRYNIPHPEMEEAEAAKKSVYPYVFQAAYPTTEKMKNSFLNSRAIHRLQQTALQKAWPDIRETLPAPLLNKLRLPALKEALVNIHFPSDQTALKKSIYRLKFEELFLIQLQLLRQQSTRKQKANGCPFKEIGDLFNDFYRNHLPFELTSAQKRVLKEIRKDVGSGSQMNRLLQGDVGSGKTLVALLTILMALDNGYQACIMAPTEILAQQHLASFSRFLQHLPVTVRLLTGSTRASERPALHEGLADGSIQILIGTHALIEDVVRFKNLGLAVIDEQHRFGVVQRARLWDKSPDHPPHVLVMTATPIPRTLAMTVYGDLDVSVIDELPPGRKAIETVHMTDSKRMQLFAFLEKQIEAGRQVYIVYPLIQESEKMDYKDLEDGYESITRRFPPPRFAVSVVHGKMKPEEKQKAMQLFVRGVTHMMVSTTVIEVGVDVPNATVMVIESAERFGLSQLHQLRGRVGRGEDQSYCILMTGQKLTTEARTRLETMVRTTDGFEIAEVDLKLRGPGDLEGTQQSGIPFDLKIAHLGKDHKILEHARSVARDILDADPLLAHPDNNLLLEGLRRIKTQHKDWSAIS